MRAFVLILLAAPLALATAPALAQNSPSASQIIDSLKPQGNLAAGGTRGIRLVAPTAAPAQSASPAHSSTAHRSMVQPAAVATGGAPAGAPSVNLTVDFATGSAALTPRAKRTLDQLGKALTSEELGKYRFRIEGHTDTVGTPAGNLALSQQRARAVADYLEQTYGVAPARLQAIGMGERGLLDPTPPQTPDARNRRVEVVNLGA